MPLQTSALAVLEAVEAEAQTVVDTLSSTTAIRPKVLLTTTRNSDRRTTATYRRLRVSTIEAADVVVGQVQAVDVALVAVEEMRCLRAK